MTPRLPLPSDSRALRYVALAAIMVLALAARLYDLSAESIWTDEAYSIDMAHRPVSEIVHRAASADTSPPLYYLALHAWQSIFGDSPAAARMPSVIAGTLAVLFAYLAAAPLFGSWGGLAAALLHALSPFHVAYSQEARQYALLSCASLASFALLVRVLRGQRFATPAYIAATIVVCYTHSVGTFVLLAQVAFVVTYAALSGGLLPWRRMLAAQAIAAAAFLPWAILLLQQYDRLDGVFWVPVPTLYSVAETFYEYVGSTVLVQLCLLLGLLGLVRATPAGGAVSLRHPVRSLEDVVWTVRLADLKATWLLICWLTIPIGVLFVISRLATPLYLTRATIAASSAFYLLAARGLTQLGGFGVLVAVLLAMLFTGELAGYYRTTTKEQWSLVARDVLEHARPGDVFVFHDRARQVPFDYYVTRQDLHRVGFPARRFGDGDSVTEGDMHTFPEWVDSSPRVWLVLSFGRDRHDRIKERLLRTRTVALHRRYDGVELWAFERMVR
ncbi:MAG: glycosyltransferase family 39 protein [Chloroflexi bacterium]|nr:glycosyltransferase family 39 protein [Chloroflexota bacterium]